MSEQWFDDGAHQDEASLKDFEDLCGKAFALKEVIEKKEDEVKEKKKELFELHLKMQAALEVSGLTSFKSSKGLIYINQRKSFKIPQTNEDRAKFFEYLKSVNAYDSLVTVNSNTLNSFCKSAVDKAVEAGDVGFKIPGIGDPVVFHEIRMKKG